MLELLIAATITALATGIGAIPVIALGPRAAAWQPMLLGISAGVMTVAAVQGLLVPAFERGSVVEVLAGVVIGVALLVGARSRLNAHPGAGSRDHRVTLLVFGVLFVHSLPEGFAIGTAYATDPGTLGLFIVVAIAIQNIPEGTSVAVPMAVERASGAKMIGAAILTSVPQPIGAAIAYVLVETVTALLPVSFGFAAGAMLTLVLIEVMPSAIAQKAGMAWLGAALGAVAMVLISTALAV